MEYFERCRRAKSCGKHRSRRGGRRSRL